MADNFRGILHQTKSSDVMYSTPNAGATPIGIVAIANDADASVFPLDKAVLLKSYGQDKQAAVGSTGTLGTVLGLVNSIGSFPPVVVARVASSTDPLEQASLVASGLELLGTASASLETEPKIIGAPGLDSEDVVIDAMVDVLAVVDGFGYIALNAEDHEEAELVKETRIDEKLMGIWPEFTKDGSPVSAVALALGMRSFIDSSIGPHKSLSNVAIPSASIDGISALVPWKPAVTSMATVLNLKHITTLIRRSGNFYFWGNRTCNTADEDSQFESDVRMGAVIRGIIDANQADTVDHAMSTAQIEDIVKAINADLATLVKRGWLLAGAKAYLDPGQNSAAVLKDGGLWVNYDYCVPKPLESLGVTGTITNRHLLQVLPEWAVEE
jgi:phage tail sheath protein FI